MRPRARQANELPGAYAEIACRAGDLFGSAAGQFITQAHSVAVLLDPIRNGIENRLEGRIGRLFIGLAGHDTLHYHKLARRGRFTLCVKSKAAASRPCVLAWRICALSWLPGLIRVPGILIGTAVSRLAVATWPKVLGSA